MSEPIKEQSIFWGASDSDHQGPYSAHPFTLDGVYPAGTYVSKEEIVPRLVKWANDNPKSREQTKHLASLVPTHFKREIKLRKGKSAAGLEDSSNRPSYKEGGLLFVVGLERFGNRRCEHCQKGNGPFDGCVVLRGFMNGCCANCRYDEYQNRCKYEYANGTKNQ